MNIETISFNKWKNSLRLANEDIELVVTTDVGPRVILFKSHQHDNVFKVFEEQLGGQNETEWMIRGGHRLWLAPEDLKGEYHIDNEPVLSRQDLATGEVLIESIQQTPQRVKKTLGLLVHDDAPRATVRHVITNEEREPIIAAPWALSVMQPGGLQIIPQPPLGSHPKDLLPNRGMVLWPYTDLSDARLTFGQKFWLLRQAEGYLPTKLGLAHREHWVAYVLPDSIFIKTFEYEAGAQYADGGCNFETFTNSEMMEIESLGSLKTLAPGESATHIEDWYVFPLTQEMSIESEDSLAEWVESFLKQTHLR